MPEVIPKPRPSFVGRERELSEIEVGLERALSGNPAFFLLSGEPGVGKTRLLEEAASRAAGHGMSVHWGRCWEGPGMPAFWPWTQILRSWVQPSDAAALGPEIGAVVAAVAGLPIGSRATTEIHPAQGALRFTLFHAVTKLLVEAAVKAPRLLVLDDLHVADVSSLLLLLFVVENVAGARLSVMGAYRGLEAASDPERSPLLVRLARAGTPIHLDGLGEREVGRLIADSQGRGARPDEARTLCRLTGGNPLFLEGVLRLLSSTPELERATRFPAHSLPPEVRESIRRRLSGLGEECRAALSFASVAGRELDLSLLAAATGRPAPELADLLDEARRGALVEAEPGTLGRYSFAHGLVSEVLYDELKPADRMQAHRRVAEALELMSGDDPGPRLSELAYHFHAAALTGCADRAIEYSRRAGERAIGLLAYEDAAAHFERALEAARLRTPADAKERCNLLLDLADAKRGAGDWEGMKNALWPAAELAVTLGARDELARAATAVLLLFEAEPPDAARSEWLRKALASLGVERNALRARLLAYLAATLSFSLGSPEERQPLADEALAIARETGDRAALVQVLLPAQWAKWTPNGIEERLALSEETVRLAEEVQNLDFAATAHTFRQCHLLEAGDRERADFEWMRREQVVEKLRLPASRAALELSRASRALLDGRFAEAEALGEKAIAIAPLPEEARWDFMPALITIRREQDRLAEIADVVRGLADKSLELPVWRAVAAWVCAKLGRRDEARSRFERAAVVRFQDFPRDMYWLAAIALLAETAASLQDLDRARLLHEMLVPYARRGAVFPIMGIYLGSVSRPLGLLAKLLDRFDEAERHFEDALEIEARMRARPWLARAQADYAGLYLRRDLPGDRERAETLAGAARAAARELAMTALDRELAALGEGTAQGSAASPAETVAVFRRHGDGWAIGFPGSIFQLRDSVGLRYLRALLASPGLDFLAGELLGERRGEPATGPSDGDLRPDLGDAGPVLDSRAKTAYRARLDDLREELEEARRFNDTGRAERASGEIEKLSVELRRAVGLSGRDRLQGALVERTRLRVTRALRRSIEKISEESRDLGEHLQRSVTTGTYCSYRPEPRSPIRWRL